MPQRTTFLGAPFALVVACATTGAAPSERVESSSAAILAAEDGGAGRIPDANVYLLLAKDQFAYSQRLPNPSDKDRVDRLLRRAQVDAELSLALAHFEDRRLVAQTAIDRATELSQERK